MTEQLMHGHPVFQKLIAKCRDALAGGHQAWSVQSTGERLAVALVLNRADWLAELDYTIPQALKRIGERWAEMVPEAAEVLHDEGAA